MKFFKSFDEFNNWNYDDCQAKLVDVFTRSGNNFVVLDRISGSYYCNPKYFETDIDAKIYAKDSYIFERVVIMLFDMEKYIASYKHLIGCEVFGLPKGRYIISVSDPNFCAEYNIPMSVCDNADYLTQFENMSGFKFYLDAGTHVNDSTTLGTYEEYMQLHYPEYEHVWKHHL